MACTRDPGTVSTSTYFELRTKKLPTLVKVLPCSVSDRIDSVCCVAHQHCSVLSSCIVSFEGSLQLVCTSVVTAVAASWLPKIVITWW
jgi:hypothetical protein